MSASTTLQTIYVAQVASVGDFITFGDATIEREGVFSSWAKAREFLAREEEVEAGANEAIRMSRRHIIIEYTLDDYEPEERTHQWIFDVSGNLLQELLPDSWRTDDFDFSGKYAVGDIVWAKPNIDCRESHSIEGYYGVVAWVPKKKDDWLAEHRPVEEWQSLYVVYYIHPYGTLCHSHEPENALDAVSDSDPKVPAFLRLYSKHLKGQLQLPQQLLADLEDGKAFLRDDLKHYQQYLDG